MLKDDIADKYNMCLQSPDMISKDSFTKVQQLGGSVKSTPAAKRSKYVALSLYSCDFIELVKM